MQRAIIMQESKEDNGGERKRIWSGGRHGNADNKKGEQSERMGHRWEHSTLQLLMLLFSGFSTKYSDKPQIMWLSGEDKWKHSFASLGFQMKGRYNLHIQKIVYINIYWWEEEHLTIFKTIFYVWYVSNSTEYKKRNTQVTDRKRDKQTSFYKEKGGKSKLGSFEGYKRQIKNMFFLKRT